MKLIGVLLAAGRSTRMGRPKQLLSWPPNSPEAKPLVAAAFDAIARVCDEMVVVVGHQADEILAALGARAFHRTNGNPKSELFSSIRLGLAMARHLDAFAAVLLQPADHPDVRCETLEALVTAANAHPDRAVMPQFRGRGGHPVLIPPPVAQLICGYAGMGGLRQFWLDYPELCLRLPVDDPGVVFDIDTPTDYDASDI